MRAVDLSVITNDRKYNRYAKELRKEVASIRRRGLIGTLKRWHDEAQPEGPVIAAEVGVKYASLTACMLTYLPFVAKIHAIDPYLEYPPDHRDRGQFGYANRDQGGWNVLYRAACKNLQPFGDRAELHRTTSLEASETCKRNDIKLHIAYLDAMHAYDDVLADCRAWWDIVLPGGLLCGDDYYPHSNWRRTTTGVSDAVDTFAAEVGVKVVGLHRSWFMQRPVGLTGEAQRAQ